MEVDDDADRVKYEPCWACHRPNASLRIRTCSICQLRLCGSVGACQSRNPHLKTFVECGEDDCHVTACRVCVPAYSDELQMFSFYCPRHQPILNAAQDPDDALSMLVDEEERAPAPAPVPIVIDVAEDDDAEDALVAVEALVPKQQLPPPPPIALEKALEIQDQEAKRSQAREHVAPRRVRSPMGRGPVAQYIVTRKDPVPRGDQYPKFDVAVRELYFIPAHEAKSHGLYYYPAVAPVIPRGTAVLQFKGDDSWELDVRSWSAHGRYPDAWARSVLVERLGLKTTFRKRDADDGEPPHPPLQQVLLRYPEAIYSHGDGKRVPCLLVPPKPHDDTPLNLAFFVTRGTRNLANLMLTHLDREGLVWVANRDIQPGELLIGYCDPLPVGSNYDLQQFPVYSAPPPNAQQFARAIAKLRAMPYGAPQQREVIEINDDVDVPQQPQSINKLLAQLEEAKAKDAALFANDIDLDLDDVEELERRLGEDIAAEQEQDDAQMEELEAEEEPIGAEEGSPLDMEPVRAGIIEVDASSPSGSGSRSTSPSGSEKADEEEDEDEEEAKNAVPTTPITSARKAGVAASLRQRKPHNQHGALTDIPEDL